MMFGLFSVDASGRQSKVVRGDDDTKIKKRERGTVESCALL